MPKDPTLIPRLRGISIVLAAQGDTMMASAIDGAIGRIVELEEQHREKEEATREPG